MNKNGGFMNIKHFLVTRPEYQKTLFNKVVGKSGKTFYYNGNPMSVWVDGDGEGMGGRTVTYEMLNGDEEEVKGPWNANADLLLKETGVDLTENFFSVGFAFLTKQDALDFEKGLDVEPMIAEKDWTKGKYDGAVDRIKDRMVEANLEDIDMQILFVNCLGGVSIIPYKGV